MMIRSVIRVVIHWIVLWISLAVSIGIFVFCRFIVAELNKSFGWPSPSWVAAALLSAICITLLIHCVDAEKGRIKKENIEGEE